MSIEHKIVLVRAKAVLVHGCFEAETQFSRTNVEWEFGTLTSKGSRAFNAFFRNCTPAATLKRCGEMERTLGEMVLATKVSIMFLSLQNQGVLVTRLNCV